MRSQFVLTALLMLALDEAPAQLETSRFGLVYGRSDMYVGTRAVDRQRSASSLDVCAVAHGHRAGPRVERGSGGGRPRLDPRARVVHAWRRVQWSALMTEPTRWQIAYRTLPDEQTIDFVPGVGISRFAYVHHGTTAMIDVHLSTVTLRRR